MRQHIINSSNVHGIQASNVSAVAIVAAHDVAAQELRTRKPLWKCMGPYSKRSVSVSPPVSSVVSESDPVATRTMTRCSSTRCTAWPAAAIEPPAAAWASLIISQAISL